MVATGWLCADCGARRPGFHHDGQPEACPGRLPFPPMAAPPEPPTYRALRELLEALGTTADEVAATLQAHRCKGEHDSRKASPLANYLDKQGYISPECDGRWVAAHSPEGYGVAVELPAAVAEFDRLFDEGCYPDLVRAKPRGWQRPRVASPTTTSDWRWLHCPPMRIEDWDNLVARVSRG